MLFKLYATFVGVYGFFKGRVALFEAFYNVFKFAEGGFEGEGGYVVFIGHGVGLYVKVALRSSVELWVTCFVLFLRRVLAKFGMRHMSFCVSAGRGM